jgi:ribonuclease P protein component
MVRYTFDKEERLKSKKTIDELFLNKGHMAFSYPLKVVFDLVQDPQDHQPCPSLVITVPKKKFKSAVARNRIKRQVKEAYRLNSGTFKSYCIEKNIYVPLVFIYIAQQAEPFEKIVSSLNKTIKSIINQHGTSTDKERNHGDGKNAIRKDKTVP